MQLIEIAVIIFAIVLVLSPLLVQFKNKKKKNGCAHSCSQCRLHCVRQTNSKVE